ncbi:Hypothetical protein CINCED_3A001166 [Cinara cedri]|uniref:Uncharacterized protein n=1 Tax=Cinara cedri TaxID=506608 RepID=A0A5E4MK38_9HEMI|nr:Hypothetical protein CINCED_3A001166 [Cinara cedri]
MRSTTINYDDDTSDLDGMSTILKGSLKSVTTWLLYTAVHRYDDDACSSGGSGTHSTRERNDRSRCTAAARPPRSNPIGFRGSRFFPGVRRLCADHRADAEFKWKTPTAIDDPARQRRLPAATENGPVSPQTLASAIMVWKKES